MDRERDTYSNRLAGRESYRQGDKQTSMQLKERKREEI